MAGRLPGGQLSLSAHEKRCFNDKRKAECHQATWRPQSSADLPSLESRRTQEGEGLWEREAGLLCLPGPLPLVWSAGALAPARVSDWPAVPSLSS